MSDHVALLVAGFSGVVLATAVAWLVWLGRAVGAGRRGGGEIMLRRGFNRLGIGVAVLVVIAGTTVAVLDQNQRIEHPRIRDNVVVDPMFTQMLDAAKTKDGGTEAEFDPVADIQIRAVDVAPPLGITVVLALGAWGFFWGLGWVAAGFARD